MNDVIEGHGRAGRDGGNNGNREADALRFYA